MSIEPVWISAVQFGEVGGVGRTKAFRVAPAPRRAATARPGYRTIRYSYNQSVVFWKTYGESLPSELPSRRYKDGKSVEAAK